MTDASGSYSQTRDAMEFLGRVAEWLRAEPAGKVEYGEFYVSKVEVRFDNEVIGHFVSDDPDWMFVANETTSTG